MLRQDCKSWFMIRKGVTTSKVRQIFVPKVTKRAKASVVGNTEELMEEITTIGSGTLSSSEKQRLTYSLYGLRVVDFKLFMSKNAIPKNGNKAALVEWIVQAHEANVFGLLEADRTFYRVFAK